MDLQFKTMLFKSLVVLIRISGLFSRYWVQFHTFLGLPWDPEQFQQDFWSISSIWSAEILASQCFYNNYPVWLHLQDFTWGCQSEAACGHSQSHFSSVVSTQQWWKDAVLVSIFLSLQTYGLNICLNTSKQEACGPSVVHSSWKCIKTQTIQSDILHPDRCYIGCIYW